MPVFAGTPEKGIGFAYMVGPTGGYLFGFIIAATVVGWLAERGFDRNIIRNEISDTSYVAPLMLQYLENSLYVSLFIFQRWLKYAGTW